MPKASAVFVQYRIYFQNDSTMVSLNGTLVELLALQLGEYPRSAEAKAVVQRWLGVTLRNRYGHLLGKDDPVEEWVRLFIAAISHLRYAGSVITRCYPLTLEQARWQPHPSN
jgi:hypothetical protein